MQIEREYEKLFFHSDEFFESLLRAINQAQKSIELETYIYEADEFGLEMDRALLAADQRGVEVRLLIDGVGSRGWLKEKAPDLMKSGVDIRVWRPLRWTGFGTKVFSHLNRRKHRKFCLIDETTAFAGSQNVSKNHLQRHMGNKAWRDTGIEFRGTGVDELLETFEDVWDVSFTTNDRSGKVKYRRAARVSAESFIRLTKDIFKRQPPLHDTIAQIQKAQKRIWITNSYLTPPRKLLRALAQAEARGVDVQIVLPKQSDIVFMRWIATSYYDVMLKNKIRVFEFDKGFLHAKSMIVDNWCIVGSSNLNTRSFVRDLELDIVLTKQSSRDELIRQFEIDIQSSQEIFEKDLPSMIFSRWLGKLFARLLRWGL